LYLALLWLSVIVIVWIFSGGLRRRFPNPPHIRAGIGIVIQPTTQPLQPTPVLFQENDGDE
jgi:hypothetical protein